MPVLTVFIQLLCLTMRETGSFQTSVPSLAMSHDNRRLTEKEIQQVFRRAAELQEKRGAELAEWGPTPADVLKLGEELGMDTGDLRTAIEEVLDGKVIKQRGFWAGLSFESDRNYHTEVTEDEWHE